MLQFKIREKDYTSKTKKTVFSVSVTGSEKEHPNTIRAKGSDFMNILQFCDALDLICSFKLRDISCYEFEVECWEWDSENVKKGMIKIGADQGMLCSY